MAGELAYAHLTDNRGEYEIIDGKVYMMAQPSIDHIQIAGNIYSSFRNYLRGKRCRTFQEPDVFLDDDNNFVPDVVIVCDPDIIKKDGIHGVPDLVVEILSPSTAKNDRTKKFAKYAECGVREYWIVTPESKLVEVYHLVDGKYILDGVYHPFTADDLKRASEKEKANAATMKLINVSLYDDFIIDVADIFEDID